MSLEHIVSTFSSRDLQEKEESFLLLLRKTKHGDDVEKLFGLNLQSQLFGLLEDGEIKYKTAVLSIFANCANINDRWRQLFIEEEKLQKLKSILFEQLDASIISRCARLIANISKNSVCLSLVQQDQSLLSLLVKLGSTIENEKCQSSCLRALRIICVTKETAKIVAEDERFPQLLTRLNSDDPDLLLLCVRFICELLKTQAIEVGFRIIEESVLHRLIDLGRHSSEDVTEIILEVLFLLTLTAGCRVTVAREGGIELFLERICNHENTDGFKYATQSLCLCAREAVSRNKMKLCGVLQEMVKVLQNQEFESYHESLVAAFVWFLFDDSSLARLVCADVTPSLLSFLDRLTTYELKQSSEFDASLSSNADVFIETPPRERRLLSAVFQPNMLNDGKRSPPHTQMICSSPETSPYHANSPQYSIPSFSPNMSPSYSPPSSPQSPLSPECRDNYSDSLNETFSLSSRSVPYHFQSADGIHAMIHGTRGPIHDTLLLLSRFSQAKNPSSLFLFNNGFNAMLNYIALSKKPNPKCPRILNRLTMNSYCFDLLLKKKLIPRLYLRLCTGWSLEHLTRLMDNARERVATASSSDSSDNDIEENEDNVFIYRDVSRECWRIGRLLLSNIQSQSELPYGSGVLSKMLLNGSNKLQKICVISIPYIIWSPRLRQRLLVHCKGFDKLMHLLLESFGEKNEDFILSVEAICALCRLIDLQTKWDMNGERRVTCQLSNEKDDDHEEPPVKRKRMESSLEETKVTLLLPSGKTIVCNREKLRSSSVVFDRMLNSVYVESRKDSITISEINENAFTTLIHYLHGCEIRLDKFCKCDSCLYPYQNNTIDDNVVMSSDWRFTMDLLSCCERFFVDKLKPCCEVFLRHEISNDNVGEIFLFSCRYNSQWLTKLSLVFLLSKLDCPKLRCQYFTEILKSDEKETLVRQIKSLVSKHLEE